MITCHLDNTESVVVTGTADPAIRCSGSECSNVEMIFQQHLAMRSAGPFSSCAHQCQGHLVEISKRFTEVGRLGRHFSLNCGLLRQSIETWST